VPPVFDMSRTLPLAVGPGALAQREMIQTVPGDERGDPARSEAVHGAGGEPVMAASCGSAGDAAGDPCGHPM